MPLDGAPRTAATTEDHALMLDAVAAAGALAMSRFGKSQQIWLKGRAHRTCEADLEVDALLHDRLLDARPSYGWLSEETEDDRSRLAMARTWVVDPIDGTNSYLNGLPEFAVSVALIEGDTPIAAAVFNPAKAELFDAIRGGGARLNGVPIRVSAVVDPAHFSLLVSRSEFREDGWPERFPPGTAHPISSIAYKLALVAAGRYDAAGSAWPKSDWDIAAGDLLVREAGCLVTTMRGQELPYNRPRPRHPTCLAANPALHAALIDHVASIQEAAL